MDTKQFKDVKCKSISVMDKDGRLLSYCTAKRATKLVNRKCAVWIGDNTLQLLINDKDRKKLRKEIVKEAGRICYICGEYIPEEQYPTLDHVIPKSDLGEDVKENLQCCCRRCNDDKGNKHISEYIKHIKKNRTEYSWISDNRIHVLELFVEKLKI